MIDIMEFKVFKKGCAAKWRNEGEAKDYCGPFGPLCARCNCYRLKERATKSAKDATPTTVQANAVTVPVHGQPMGCSCSLCNQQK